MAGYSLFEAPYRDFVAVGVGATGCAAAARGYREGFAGGLPWVVCGNDMGRLNATGLRDKCHLRVSASALDTHALASGRFRNRFIAEHQDALQALRPDAGNAILFGAIDEPGTPGLLSLLRSFLEERGCATTLLVLDAGDASSTETRSRIAEHMKQLYADDARVISLRLNRRELLEAFQDNADSPFATPTVRQEKLLYATGTLLSAELGNAIESNNCVFKKGPRSVLSSRLAAMTECTAYCTTFSNRHLSEQLSEYLKAHADELADAQAVAAGFSLPNEPTEYEREALAAAWRTHAATDSTADAEASLFVGVDEACGNRAALTLIIGSRKDQRVLCFVS